MKDRFAVQSWRTSRTEGRQARPSVFARAPERILLICVIVSLLAHVGLAYALRDRPLGYVDPDSLQRESTVLKVRRATYDQVRPAQGQAEDAGPTQQQAAAALLSEQLDPPTESESPEPELELREIEETLPPRPAPELAVEAAAFELPEHALDSLHQAGLGNGTGAGSGNGVQGEGDGPGGGGSGSGAMASAAQQTLQQAGFVGSGSGGSAMPEPGRDTFDDSAPSDKRLLDAPLQSPEIDFTRIALDQTTRLDVPEHLDNDFTYELTRYEPANERGYFRVNISTRQSLKKLETMPKDVVFLVDTSSSIPQQWVSQVMRGVEQGLGAMNDGDRFNVVLFNEQLSFFSDERVVAATNDNISAARQWLSNVQSRGWTNMDAALSRLLVRDLDPDRVYDIILISDGKPTRGVVQMRTLINNITRENNNVASIYCVGVGRDQDRETLEFLAYRNKGYCRFADELDEAAPTIRRLMGELRYPLIKDAELRWAGAEINNVYPSQPRNIHQGETLSVFGRYVAAEQFTMQITGRNGPQAVDFTFKRDLSRADRGSDSIARDWAFWKLHHLYSRIMIEGETQGLKSQVGALRRKYELRTIY